MNSYLKWTIEPLAGVHERESFCCGLPTLDEYIRKYARQDQKRDLGRSFVAVIAGQQRVDGYYTLASACERQAHLPLREVQALPRYDIPVVLLARLAVSLECQGQGLGEALLFDAFARTKRLADEIGLRAMVVWAIDERARDFYLRYGFIPLLDDRLHLYLPLSVIRKLNLR